MKKTARYKIVLFNLLMVVAGTALAQDVQFSQYYQAPLFMNPGFTGITPQQRLVGNWRLQWPNLPQAYATYAFSYDIFVDELRSGFGVLVTTDKMGSAGWQTTTAGLLYSFKVKISETKSMCFGESQNLVKKIFTDYCNFKKTQKICPILLFNEADAIIGKRKSASSSSVADTENAIQNVLLEELENFDGILFATSNLVANLDSAFERRFLFKVKFENPSMVNAAKIWRNKLPFLSAKEALQLASQFSYSGGEMENIARKSLMDEIVFGTKHNFERILSFCENEKWSSKSGCLRIGY